MNPPLQAISQAHSGSPIPLPPPPPRRPPEPQPPPSAPAPSPSPLRIAVLLNSYRSRFIGPIRASYERALAKASKSASVPVKTLRFFYPAEPGTGEALPDPTDFDLVVLGGGNVDARKDDLGWVLAVKAFVRLVVEEHPQVKICGICWGHQAVALAFGGVVTDMEVPELGVTERPLTPLGATFFPALQSRGVVRLQQHHRRAVSVRPRGFRELMAGNECLVNRANTILTFQGHPEKDAETAKLRVWDAERWLGVDCADANAVGALERRMEARDDGMVVWERVLTWATEEKPG